MGIIVVVSPLWFDDYRVDNPRGRETLIKIT